MAADGQDTLHGFRSHLKEKLDHCFARADEDDPRKRFARNGVTRELFEAQRLTHLFRLLLYGHVHNVDQSAVHRLDRIARIIRGSGDAPAFCNVLACLLYARCMDETLRDWAESLLRDKLRGIFSDSDLPLSESEAENAFGSEDGLSFWEHQFLFCPVILEEGDESVYVGHRQSCPLPFLNEPQRIGKGTYATVYKVQIERGHLINRAENSALLSCKEYAQKVYFDYDATAKRSFEAEGTTIKKFVQSAKSHENILVTKASLEYGGTYSLFFDLARCSLDDYFMDPRTNITSLEQKKAVLGQTSGIAGALAHLHDELYITSTGEQLRCYHLDLKPQNILVFDSDEGDIWKISDFGISQIKRVPVDQAHLEDHKHPTSFLDLIFRRGGDPDTDPSSGVDNSRYGGTYAAPEARLATDKVTRTSDVWSLGCVLALVLTFLDNGSDGILKFVEARVGNRDNDRFFEPTSSDPAEKSEFVLHSSVEDWLDSLVQNATRRQELEGKVVQEAIDLLRNHMLLVNPRQRYSAKEVETELRSIQATFPESFDAVNEVAPEDDSQDIWQFEIPDSSRECRFSPDGKHLGILSNEAILTNLVTDMQEGKAGKTHLPPRGGQWADFSLGTKYICATLESRWFECVYMSYSSAGTPIEHHVQQRGSAPIRKVVISPDNDVTAFVLEEAHQQEKFMRVALYHTEEIIGSYSISIGAAASHKISSISTSHTVKTTGDLPWLSLIQEARDFDLPTTAGVVDLKFSSDSKILMAVTKPYKRERNHLFQYSIFSWDVTTGRGLSILTTKNEESEDLADAWRVETFALCAKRHSFAAISRTKIRLGTYEPLRYVAHSRTMADQILDILVDEITGEFILIGRARYRDNIKAFRLSPTEIDDDLESLDRSTETGLNSYNPVTDSCCAFGDEQHGEQGVLIANMDTGRKTGMLSLAQTTRINQPRTPIFGGESSYVPGFL